MILFPALALVFLVSQLGLASAAITAAARRSEPTAQDEIGHHKSVSFRWFEGIQ
jgi:hypothetical protein